MTSNWKRDDFLLIFLAYLRSITCRSQDILIPLSTFLALWHMFLLVPLCSTLAFSLLDSFVPTSSILLCFNGLHQWPPFFLASGWIWPIDNEKTVSMRDLFPQLWGHQDRLQVSRPFHTALVSSFGLIPALTSHQTWGYLTVSRSRSL